MAAMSKALELARAIVANPYGDDGYNEQAQQLAAALIAESDRVTRFEAFAKQAHVAAEFAIAHLPITPRAIGVTSGIIDLRASTSTIAMMGWVAQEADALINGEEARHG
jgi:hypothetical protein